MSPSSESYRKVFAVLILVIGVTAIVFIFWKQEMKYALPAKVPDQYLPVLPGQKVDLPSSLRQGSAYFFHFYNPDCPCSRFNAQHIQSLIRNYGDSIRFTIVIPDASALDLAKEELGADLNFISDTDHTIAKACGVYSTPQAAIIDREGKLFYRGNYNRARYCTTRASNFAELSLIALINKQPAQVFGLAATQAYGCELHDPESDIELF